MLAVCAKDAFKNSTAQMLTLDDYMDNTVNVTENILLGYSFMKFTRNTSEMIEVIQEFFNGLISIANEV